MCKHGNVESAHVVCFYCAMDSIVNSQEKDEEVFCSDCKVVPVSYFGELCDTCIETLVQWFQKDIESSKTRDIQSEIDQEDINYGLGLV